MPNTLVHFATQGAASRGLWRRLDPRWIYIGCLLPDLPWILRRVVVALGLPVDAFDLRLYSMAQASLAGTLLLCGVLAAVAAAPRLVFAVLGANALLHLLLDATEIKWGNGVHLLAPFSWKMSCFELLNGEGLHILLLSLAGAALVAWEILRPHRPRLGLVLRPRRLAGAGLLLIAYFLFPLPFLDAVERSDSYSVRTLRHPAERPGRQIGVDRTDFLKTPEGGLLDLWTGERIRVSGPMPDHDARVSLRGTFLEPHLLHIDGFAEHHTQRDWPSYLALGLLAVLWVAPSRRKKVLPALTLVLAADLALAAPPGQDEGEARISLDVKEAPVVDIVQALAETGGLQAIFDPGISCRLTMKLPGARWRSVLDTTLSACRLGYEEEGNVLRVAPLARLQAEAAARRSLSEERRAASSGRLATFRLSYARAQELAPLLQRLLSPTGRASYDSRTNTLVLTY